MKKIIFIAVMAMIVMSGCATKITLKQEKELDVYKAKGLYVEEKSTGAAAGLGLLPGGGYFYAREYELGVVNLLLWPASILWDPISGVYGSERINYRATKLDVDEKKHNELALLEKDFEDKKIDQSSYINQKRKIEDRYSSSWE